MIKFFKIFELNNKGVVVYHGGNKLTNDNIKDGGVFTTTDKDGAMWYIHNNSGDNWLTKMIVNIQNPLTCKNKKDFKEKWIPILDESKIDYTFDEDNGIFEFISDGFHIQENMNDLVYIKEFVNVAIKHGYDGIINWDSLPNGQIMIYIPFFKRSIIVIDSEFFPKRNHGISTL